LKGIKIIHANIFIIEINYEFTFGPELTTSIRIKCSARMRRILGSRLCLEAPLEDEYDLIKAKVRAMNEQIHFGVYIKNLDKYEVEVLTMQERIAFAAKL
jgi:hypothetical protein